MIQFLIAAILAYLIGSIPTSYILANLYKGIDIRKYGSGNIGATNTLRVLGKRLGTLVLLFDMAKGAFCATVLPATCYNATLPLSLPVFKACLAGIAIAGHIWTVFLKFKGGKGVATTCGALLSLSLVPTSSGILIWLFVVVISKYVSLASLVMAGSLPILMLLFQQPFAYFILSLLLFWTIVYTHRDNIRRLAAGREKRITEKISPTT